MLSPKAQLSALLFVIVAAVAAQDQTAPVPTSSSVPDAPGTLGGCVNGCANLIANKLGCSTPDPTCICGSRARMFNEGLKTCVTTNCQTLGLVSSSLEQHECQPGVNGTATSAEVSSAIAGSQTTLPIVISTITKHQSTIPQSVVTVTPSTFTTSSISLTTSVPTSTGNITVTDLITSTSGRDVAPPASSSTNSTSAAVASRQHPGWMGAALIGSVGLGLMLR